MSRYLYFAQTPELKSLRSQKDRDTVHSIAWRQLRSDQPQFWTRSFFIVAFCAATASLIGYPFLHLLPSGPWGVGMFKLSPIACIGAIGGAIGAMIHIHHMATALRPYYARIFADRDIT